jgi:hypothetical protein
MAEVDSVVQAVRQALARLGDGGSQESEVREAEAAQAEREILAAWSTKL